MDNTVKVSPAQYHTFDDNSNSDLKNAKFQQLGKIRVFKEDEELYPLAEEFQKLLVAQILEVILTSEAEDYLKNCTPSTFASKIRFQVLGNLEPNFTTLISNIYTRQGAFVNKLRNHLLRPIRDVTIKDKQPFTCTDDKCGEINFGESSNASFTEIQAHIREKQSLFCLRPIFDTDISITVPSAFCVHHVWEKGFEDRRFYQPEYHCAGHAFKLPSSPHGIDACFERLSKEFKTVLGRDD